MRFYYIVYTLMMFYLINFNLLRAQEKLNSPEKQRSTYITGKIKKSIKHDTLTLILHGPFFYDGAPERGATQVITTTPNKNGEFKFSLSPGNSPFHISLFLSSKRDNKSGYLQGNSAIDDYLIEPGDSIAVDFKKVTPFFSGIGSALFEAQYSAEQVDKDRYSLTRDTLDYFNKNSKEWLLQKDSLLNLQLQVLSTYKSKLTSMAYAIARADIIGMNRSWIYRRINFAGPFLSSGLKLNKNLSDLCQELESRIEYIGPADRAVLSPKYISYLYEKLRNEVKYDRIIHKIHVKIDENYFPAITKQYTGMLRDKLLAWWLTRLTSFNDLKPEYITSALSVMQTPVFTQMVENLKTVYAKGQPIADFDFKDAKNRIVHLADLKGKVLVIDFWFSGCSGCVAVAAGLPHVEKTFNDGSDVAFISISIDKDRKQWLRSISKHPVGISYTHYTTSTTTYLYTGGTGSNNEFIKKYVPDGTYPSLLIIDKEGKIYSSIPSHPVDKRGQEELTKEIKEALAN